MRTQHFRKSLFLCLCIRMRLFHQLFAVVLPRFAWTEHSCLNSNERQSSNPMTPLTNSSSCAYFFSSGAGRGYCHCSTSNPLALNGVLWMSLPQLLTLWEMMKYSLPKRTCSLNSCCISYLNDDSGILEEGIKGEKKKNHQNENLTVEVDKY